MHLRRKIGEDIGDQEVLSQYGSHNSLIDGRPFRSIPKFPKLVNAVSLYRGKGTIAEVKARVAGLHRPPRPGDGVRYAGSREA